MLAALLWAKIARDTPQGHSAIWPELEGVQKKFEQLISEVHALLQRVEKATHALEHATEKHQAYRPAPAAPHAQ